MDEREERGKAECGELYLRLKGMGVFSLREYARAEGAFAPTERNKEELIARILNEMRVL